jgi:hypothetical protein
MRVGTRPKDRVHKLVPVLARLRYRKSPSFLGHFALWSRSVVGLNRARPRGVPDLLWLEVQALAQFFPYQEFNRIFVQCYFPGQGVRRHRDPASNKGHTVLGLYGDFSTTRLVVGQKKVRGVKDREFLQQPGEVYALPCTQGGLQGPYHEVNWVGAPRGTRYAVILSTSKE